MQLLQRLTAHDLQNKNKNDLIWINPLGGLGDILMLSGVLKSVVDQYPHVKFNLMRRTRYTTMLKGHPAVACIGFPPEGAQIIGSDYWMLPEYSKKERHAFQLLAEKFGLKTPIDDTLFIAPAEDEDYSIMDIIPRQKKTIVVAPSSDSPRKMAPEKIWSELIDILRSKGCFVIQVGRIGEPRLGHAYSLLGQTTPRQLIEVVRMADAVVTVDNFIMHVGHLTQTPTVALWGPTDSKVYGYKKQFHVIADNEFCAQKNICIGPLVPNNYPIPCPLGGSHCMQKISIVSIVAFLNDNKLF